jgi:tetratricopeptide (TPR) repeat protein
LINPTVGIIFTQKMQRIFLINTIARTRRQRAIITSLIQQRNQSTTTTTTTTTTTLENDLREQHKQFMQIAQEGKLDKKLIMEAQQKVELFVQEMTVASNGKRPTLEQVREALAFQFTIHSFQYFHMKKDITNKPRELLALCNTLLEYEPNVRDIIDPNVWYYRFTDIYFTRALCYMYLKKLEYALESFNFMIDKRLKPLLHHPDIKEDDNDRVLLESYFKQSLKNRYSILLELNKLDKALGDVSRYNELYPGDDESTYHLANTHFKLGQIEPALAAGKKLLSAHTDREWRLKGKQLLVTIIRHIFDSNTPEAQEKALSICHDLIQSYPYEQELYLSRSYLYSHMGQYDKALADTETYLSLGGRPLLIFEVRYQALIKAERTDAALQEIKGILKSWDKNIKGFNNPDVVKALHSRLFELQSTLEKRLAKNE